MTTQSNTVENPPVAELAETTDDLAQSPEQAGETPLFKTIKNIVVGGGALGLIFLIGRAVVRKIQQNRSFNQTDDYQSPSYFALRLKQAMENDNFFGFNTDEPLIRATLKEIPHLKFWDKVKTAYARLTKGENLMLDLDKDLSRHEKRGVDMILAVLPKDEKEAKARAGGLVTAEMLWAWAERIKAASDHESSWIWPYGTDEDAIYEIISELPTYQTIAALDRVYRQMFSIGLFDQLADELDSSEMMHVYELIARRNNTTVADALESLAYHLGHPQMTA